MPTLTDETPAIFDSLLRTNITATERGTVLEYLERFEGLSFDLSADAYILNPGQVANPSDPNWSPEFTANFLWGNWVGSGTGAGRFADQPVKENNCRDCKTKRRSSA